MIAHLSPCILDLGCCGLTALQLGAPGHVLAGFRPPDGRFNVLIVSGRITPPLVPWLAALYRRLGAPRWVIAFGTCAVSGAVWDTPETRQIIPVDIEIPGCPPSVQALEQALSRLSPEMPWSRRGR